MLRLQLPPLADAQRSREDEHGSEKVSGLMPYLPRIELVASKAEHSIVDKIFHLPPGSYANLTESTPAKSCPITPTLGTYRDESCFICSIHHVSYSAVEMPLTLAVPYPREI